MMLPLYTPQKPKKNSKCLVHFFVVFVFGCLILFIFTCIVYPIKNPSVKINSVTINSLNYDNSPSFNLTALLKVSIKNRNFGYLDIDQTNNNTVSILYGNNGSVVGSSELNFRNGRVEARGKEDVLVEMKVNSNGLQDYDRMKLNGELNSGSLELMCVASFNSNVHLLKDKFMKSKVAHMNCTIGIDLRTKSVQKLIC